MTTEEYKEFLMENKVVTMPDIKSVVKPIYKIPEYNRKLKVYMWKAKDRTPHYAIGFNFDRYGFLLEVMRVITEQDISIYKFALMMGYEKSIAKVYKIFNEHNSVNPHQIVLLSQVAGMDYKQYCKDKHTEEILNKIKEEGK
jgi:hypothetical protein